MKKWVAGGGHLLRRIRACSAGLAMIEFAMILPVMVLLGLGGLELSNYVLTRSRVSQISMVTADNAARVRDSISESDVNELFIGAKLSGESIKLGERGRIILSSVEENQAKTGQYIRWQRCYGKKKFSSSIGAEGKGKSDSSLQAIGSPGRQISALPGSGVMVVELSYDYQPLVPSKFMGDKTFTYLGAYNVRQRHDQVIKSGGLSSGQWSTCDKFQA